MARPDQAGDALSVPNAPDRTGTGTLSAQFDELSDLLGISASGMVDPERVVKVAATAVPHATHCGVTLLRLSHPPRTVAATGPLPLTVDELQYRLGEGPCLLAAESAAIVRADDLSADRRWPSFGPACVNETAIHNMLSFHLPLQGGDQAAMNFYASQAGSFDDADVGVGSILSTFAALAVQGMLLEQDRHNFTTALNSSRQIGTAVGVLMAQEKVTAVEAFQRLKHASNHLNRKLADIAAEVEQTGQLPSPPGGR